MVKPRKAGVFADVLIVSHSAGGALAKCLRSLVSERQYIGRVLIYENGGSSPVLLPPTGLDVSVFCGKNRGFGAGCNALFARSCAPYVLFLNPDARLLPGSLLKMLLALKNHPGCSACGCAVVGGFSNMRFPTARDLCLRALQLKPYRQKDQTRSGYADWVLGACLLVERQAFQAAGGFDEGFFLFFEETDLCLRLRALGRATYYCAQARAEHAGGGSEKIRPMRAFRHARSRLRYARKHLGRRACLCLFACTLLLEPPALLCLALLRPFKNVFAKKGAAHAPGGI